MSGPQGGGGSFNFTNTIEEHGDYIVWMLKTMRDRGADIVDIKKEPEDAYAAHCREADIGTASAAGLHFLLQRGRRGGAGSLAYYGGGRWHKYRVEAQQTLDPYVFESSPGSARPSG